jgi:hypothetical protein
MAAGNKSNRYLQRLYGQLAKSPVLPTSYKEAGEIRKELETAIFDGHAVYRPFVSEHNVERISNVQSFGGSTHCNIAGRMVSHSILKALIVIRYNSDDTILFSSFGGSSWHRADANFIFWVNTSTAQVMNIANTGSRLGNMFDC